MRFLSTLAMALALSSGAAMLATAVPDAAYAQRKPKAPKPPKLQLSKEFQALAGPVQKQLDGANPAEALPGVNQLLAQPLVGDEAEIAGTFAIQLGLKLNDTDLQSRGVQMRLNNQNLPADARGKLLFFAGDYARRANDTAKAEEFFKASIAAGFASPDPYLQLGNIASTRKEHAQAVQYFTQAIDLQTQSGGEVPEPWYQAARDRALATGDKQLYRAYALKWASAYPSKDSWRDAILAYRFTTSTDANENLEVLRFMRVANAMTDYQDYKEFAEEAQRKSLYGEIVAVLEAGQADNVLTSDDTIIEQYLTPARAQTSADKASLPAAPGDVRGTGSASVMMNFGDVWFGYNNLANARAFYQESLSRSAPDANRAHIGIGTAHAKGGDLVAAREAFMQVSGSRKGLADLWIAWIDQQMPKPAPTVAAATTES